jgi:hypothetical protein
VTVNASYNTTSITDNGTGDYTWVIATDFSSANWACVGISGDASSTALVSPNYGINAAIAAGSIRFTTASNTASIDSDKVFLAGFGDQ